LRFSLFLKTLVAAALLAVAAATAPWAAEVSLGTFKNWQAYTFDEGGKTVCVVWGKPEKEEGDYTKRGDVRAFIAHRTWTKPERVNEISFETGYPYQKDSAATVTIDGKKFELFTDGDTAWNRSAQDDAEMVKAMRIGKEMTIVGQSGRGTKTTDTYSLFGFTAAHNAINEACKVK
jgi:hypothetical protein